MANLEEFEGLAQTGFSGGGTVEQVAPEDEFFHSVYIAGQTRKNHINIDEEEGKLQVRGVEYNLDEVNMVITHTKDILVKVKNEKGRENIECFSYKDGASPWYGTSVLSNGSKRQCPQTSAERAVTDFCGPCRSQILVAGIYCKADGSPILTDERKPIFVFIRAKGIRYSNVSNYLNELFKEDLTPIFEPVTEQSKDFEKRVVNNKRFVTKITRGKTKSSFGGSVNVFELSKGTPLGKEAVLSILKLTKQTVDKFNEKFDWSKRKQTSGYGSTQRPEGVLTMDQPGSEIIDDGTGNDEEVKTDSGKSFSFEDINF